MINGHCRFFGKVYENIKQKIKLSIVSALRCFKILVYCSYSLRAHNRILHLTFLHSILYGLKYITFHNTLLYTCMCVPLVRVYMDRQTVIPRHI